MRIFVFFSLVFLFPNNLNANNLFAQFEEVGEHYDPFADYSEFEEASEEEADVHFFKNGRPLAIGGFLGPRIFTGTLRTAEKGFSLGGGGFLNFFFSLRNSVQLGYFRSQHKIENEGTNLPIGKTLTEDTTLSEFLMDVKYYFNTQNVTKGLAAINPYVLLGLSRFTRLQKINWKDIESPNPKNAAWSVNTGLGVEFPFARNKSYFGIEVKFQLVSFIDENEDRTVSHCYVYPDECDSLTEEQRVEYPDIAIEPRFDQSGDLATGVVFIGFNF